MKNHKLKLSFLLFLLGFYSTYSQYTEVINSNKPGFSESPYSVGSGVYQFESNLFLKDNSIEPTFSVPQSFGFDLIFRTSFFSEKLEFNTQITYQRDKVAFKNIFISDYFSSGLSRVTIGAKYLLFQQLGMKQILHFLIMLQTVELQPPLLQLNLLRKTGMKRYSYWIIIQIN